MPFSCNVSLNFSPYFRIWYYSTLPYAFPCSEGLAPWVAKLDKRKHFSNSIRQWICRGRDKAQMCSGLIGIDYIIIQLLNSIRPLFALYFIKRSWSHFQIKFFLKKLNPYHNLSSLYLWKGRKYWYGFLIVIKLEKEFMSPPLLRVTIFHLG